ncbi:methyltransferase MppJ [Pochonia chlamydosporia 170]|uniref:Methyltransferase MppJ n=1 Tax=Pochonia chlamydosporia 170 TaxID=1380566 RepID=A0A179G3H3_METCM|nr:methyltransferase MppJ [Pochonia chlamydosporia 170]OAQ72008.1 methyltransferase MppJ [Pochonia chlamydosporia 170]
MGSISCDSERAVAGIFNSAVAAWAIGPAWELGLLDELRNNRVLNAKKFAQQNNLHSGSTEGMVAALAIAHIVTRDGDNIIPGPLFDETYRSKSLFHWLCLGSGELFSKMQYHLRNENRKGEDYYTRDAAAIAYACRDINTYYFDPAFWAAMGGLGYDFKSVVDLGCGSGKRLMQILDSYPGTKAIGVDLASPSLQVAAAEAKQLGYGGRLNFVEGDARNLQYREEFAEVDLLTCFMMGHDFWPRESCIKTLRRLHDSFPNVKRFVLGDATRILLNSKGSRTAVPESNVPIFTLGFELGHEMMGVYMPTMDEWDSVFETSGWRCVKKHPIPNLTLSIVFVLERL